jgi:L-ascorbate metabolism protein UlaG (beta-lactamase superfamily)
MPVKPAPFLKGLRKERVLASPQFAEGRFRNPSGKGPGLNGSSWPVVLEYFTGSKRRKPQAPLPLTSPLEAWTRPVSQSRLRITWLGHSTLYIECDGVRLLTDPVFGERASPVSFAGAKRFHGVPARLEQLPPIDAVLLSHDHFDHLCRPTMQALAKMDMPIITSLGVGAHIESCGVNPKRIVELDWWHSFQLPGHDLSFTAAPAQHFSGRSLTDRNATLWSSWVIATPHRRLFFSGDTGLTEAFIEVRERLGPFEVIMLEIGAWHQAWGDIHLGPHNALKAFDMLNGPGGSGALLPVHWGTFDLALHPWDEPAETLFTLTQAQGKRLLTPSLGKPFEPAHIDRVHAWWRDVGR